MTLNRFIPTSAYRVLVGFFLLLDCLGGLACKPKSAPVHTALYAPRKNDLYVLNGNPFTLSEFHTLRAQFPSLDPKGVILLSGYATEAQRISKRKLSLRESAEWVRPLLLPKPQGATPASLNQEKLRCFDAGSPKEFGDKLQHLLQAAPTQWNLPILKEIGVSKPPWG